MKHLFLMITATMSALAVGCVEGGSYNSDLAGDELGQAQLALGEVGCGTISMTGMAAANGISRSTTGVQQSPDWTYNPGTTCPLQYLVEYTNLPPFGAVVGMTIGTRLHGGTTLEDITNQTDCERTHHLTGYYVWDTSTSSPTITTTQESAVWSSGACVSTLTGTPPRVDGKYKVRVGARTLYCSYADGCTDAQRTNLRVEVFPHWGNDIPPWGDP